MNGTDPEKEGEATRRGMGKCRYISTEEALEK